MRVFGEKILKSGKAPSGFGLGGRTDSWLMGRCCSWTNLVSPWAGREQRCQELRRCRRAKAGLQSSMPRAPQQQHQAQRKRTECCKGSYLNRLGWGKGGEKNLKKKSRPALFGSKPSSLRWGLNCCSVICQGKLQLYWSVGFNSMRLGAQISIG